MKRPRPPARRPSWRPWLFPALALVVLVTIWETGFDLDDVRSDLAAGRIDEALATLAGAGRGDLLPELLAVTWWPALARRARIDELAAVPDEDLLEAADLPTIVAPLDALRSAPDTVVLREPTTRLVRFELVNVELQLPAAQHDVPAGSERFDFGVTLIPGTSYAMSLALPEGDELLAFAGFHLLGAAAAREVGLTMATAKQLAPDEPSGELLAALVAMHHGLTHEALERLRSLSATPGYETVVRELIAIALAEQGLDRAALSLIAEAS